MTYKYEPGAPVNVDYAAPVLSFSQALKIANDRATGPENALPGAGLQSRKGSASFTKTRDLPEAIQLARTGWPEGSKRMLTAAATAVQPDRAPAFALSVAGAYPDVPAFCAGNPEHMVCPAEDSEHGSRPIVTLYVPGAYSAGTDHGTIAAVGLALLGVIDSLENAGVSVCVVWTNFVNIPCQKIENGPVSREYALTRVVVKDHGEHLDIDRLAFVLAHPSMLRRIWFALCETDPRTRAGSKDGTYGRVVDQVPSTLVGEVGAVVLPPIGSQYGGARDVVTIETARETIAAVLQHAGIILPDEAG